MGVIKIKNKYGLTTEHVKGRPISYKQDDLDPVNIGVLTHADEYYLYACFDGDKDCLIEFSNDVSLELRSE